MQIKPPPLDTDEMRRTVARLWLLTFAACMLLTIAWAVITAHQ